MRQDSVRQMLTWISQFSTHQYLGFGMPASSSEGRRAAQASAAPMDNDQAERDANLKKVQARDLVEFGMIPVSWLTFSADLQNLC